MRDSLVGLAILVGIVGGFLYLKRHGWLDSNPTRPEVVAKADKATRGRKAGKTSVGNRSHENDTIAQSNENRREDEGSSSNVAETESLTSIYQQAPKVVSQASPSTRVAVGKKAKAKPKVLYGVPVDAWVRSQSQSFGMPAIADVDDMSMRFFVQCVELKKKGAEALTQKQCKPLQEPLVNIAKRSYDRNSNFQ